MGGATLRADQAGEPLDLAHEALMHVHHLVDGVADAAGVAAPLDAQARRELALAHGDEDVEQLPFFERLGRPLGVAVLAGGRGTVAGDSVGRATRS